jgi:RecA/RadA recombinase
MERTKNTKKNSLTSQLKGRLTASTPEKKQELDGDVSTVISTGSTLIDLAISGGRIRGGGLPGGILVEVFGPSGSGKTIFLSQVAGEVQKQGGSIMFHDPEARLNEQFSLMFGMKIDEKNYFMPDRIEEVFKGAREWKPEDNGRIHGIFADSLAALTTQEEMDENDPYGMRRGKEFSKELRLTCREIKKRNWLMICSNQIRDVVGATQYQEKTKSPGGRAWEFYPSVRLRFSSAEKIILEKEIAGKKQGRAIGVETTVYVYKNSVWKPYRSAPLHILFDYGIDDIKANLQFIKSNTLYTTYTLGGESLSNEMNKAIKMIESDNLEAQLREEVIDLWEEIEERFKQERKPKL